HPPANPRPVRAPPTVPVALPARVSAGSALTPATCQTAGPGAGTIPAAPLQPGLRRDLQPVLPEESAADTAPSISLPCSGPYHASPADHAFPGARHPAPSDVNACAAIPQSHAASSLAPAHPASLPKA